MVRVGLVHDQDHDHDRLELLARGRGRNAKEVSSTAELNQSFETDTRDMILAEFYD